MYKYRYREEDFGYIVALEDGWIDVYGKEAKDAIESQNMERLRKFDPLFDSKNIIQNKKNGNKKNKFDIVDNRAPIKSPLVVQLELTLDCNLDCKHCFNVAGKSRQNEMTDDEIKKTIAELKSEEIFSLFFTGGEPTLRKNFTDFVNYAHDHDLDYFILTNGTTITDKMLKKLPPTSYFVVSCDGISSHEKIRGSKFSRLEKTFDLLRDKGFPVAAQYTLQRDNFEGIMEAYDFFAEREIDYGAIDIYKVGRAKDHPEIFITEKELPMIRDLIQKKFEYEKKQEEWTKRKMLSEKRELPNPEFFSFIGRLEEAYERSYSANFFAYINSEGFVYPDNWHNSDNLYCGGNLREREFKDIWENSFDEIRELSKWSSYPECKTCELGDYFCDFRLPVLSQNVRGELNRCGSTETLKKVMIMRKELRAKGKGFYADKARSVDVW